MTDRRDPSIIAWRNRLFWLAVLLMFAAALAAAVRPLLTLPRQIPIDYNEGWNAMWSDVAVAGGALYPAPDSSVANNYPPLSFFVMGLPGRLLGDNVLAGRLIALLSLCGIVLGIFYWLRVTGSPTRIAAAGAAIFAVTFVGFAPYYIAINDPQLLAHAVMTAAMVVLWRRDFATRSVAAAAALAVVAGFIKHLLLPMPLAATIDLALFRPTRLPVWIVVAAVVALLLCTATWLAYGANFVHDLLAGRVFSLHVAKVATTTALLRLRPVLILALAAVAGVWLSWRNGRSPARFTFALLYLVFACLIGAFAAGGAGVDANAFFDLLIAASMCAALGLEAIESAGSASDSTSDSLSGGSIALARGSVALLALWIVTVPSATQVERHLARDVIEISRLDAREAASRSVIRTLQQEGGGHAACEDLAFCYWARIPFEVDLYNYGQKLKIGLLPNSSCEALFGTSRIRLLELNNSRRGGRALITEQCYAVIQAHFAVIPSPSPEWTLLRNEVR